MLNSDKTGLLIFDNFKYQNNKNTFQQSGIVVNGSSFVMNSNGEIVKNTNKKDNFVKRWWKKRKENQKNPKVYFNKVKDYLEQFDGLDLHQQEKNSNILFDQAKENLQTALEEKLSKIKQRIKSEYKLVESGFNIFIDESHLIKLEELSPKGIRLDWMENFTRIIPEDVLESYKKAKDNNLFENYVILHYDPDNTGSELTEKEIEDKKDPILFGVNSYSRRLYYIDDWIDEYCDLTLDKLMSVIGSTDEEHLLLSNIDKETKEL